MSRENHNSLSKDQSKPDSELQTQLLYNEASDYYMRLIAFGLILFITSKIDPVVMSIPTIATLNQVKNLTFWYRKVKRLREP